MKSNFSNTDGGTFWSELNRRLADPVFARAFAETSRRIVEADARVNAGVWTPAQARWHVDGRGGWWRIRRRVA